MSERPQPHEGQTQAASRPLLSLGREAARAASAGRKRAMGSPSKAGGRLITVLTGLSHWGSGPGLGQAGRLVTSSGHQGSTCR